LLSIVRPGVLLGPAPLGATRGFEGLDLALRFGQDLLEGRLDGRLEEEVEVPLAGVA
jgi:hypothetical protein